MDRTDKIPQRLPGCVLAGAGLAQTVARQGTADRQYQSRPTMAGMSGRACL